MTQSTPALFLADSAGLDFLNSVATPTDAVVDWLEDGESLLDWLRQADMVPEQVLADLRERALPGELERLAAQARTLREWFRGFVTEHRGHPLTESVLPQLDPLNELLELDRRYSAIAGPPAGTEGPLTLTDRRRWNSPDTLLLPIAQAMAELICDQDFTHIKSCEGPTCTLLFADRTRGRGRRWCSMSLCGNRAKQAAHRRRHRAASAPPG
ncbi:CGNR zinc finger domain-containing protein [Nocardia sp. NEAU-G5]|uniref:CGNR zinc finger domain-containing protein n=1 Tax=Nocardia albiluteola TaxID=2842303 RepID=A0ABS6AZW9_9NOCA|nr:ABATE domain-containing protein [Nocardia albiluteola]MBU3062575.1 CGNR zinc finger domain-containing protein [Nocardia albiluteola]MBU3065591.1 CGNR zinc finger domain-containing protein [Nocardia albiluteola]